MEKATSTWTTTNRVLEREKACCCGVFLTAGTGAAAAITIYDGVNNTGEVRFVGRTLANTTILAAPRVHIPCRNGIYVEISGAGAGALIQHRREE